ncbi:MAG: aromatic-ring-hydroxylating dioxygenase subunit beta [Myxococcota bacterium]
MARDPGRVGPELQHEVEQFYYREARLLDGRRYQTWLGLCTEDVRYVMPGRSNPLVDNAERGREAMIGVERELEGVESDGLPVRDESLFHLTMRVNRAYAPNSWAENPPARTRRIIGNVEVLEVSDDQLAVTSNFHLSYSRPGSASFLYAGQRRDLLRRGDEGLRIASREVVMDLANIEFPTLGLFF